MTLKVLKIPVRRLLHCKEVLTAGERLLTLNYHQNDAGRFNPTILYAPDLTSLAGLWTVIEKSWMVSNVKRFQLNTNYVCIERAIAIFYCGMEMWKNKPGMSDPR